VGPEESRKHICRKDFEYTEAFFHHVLAAPRNRMEVYWAAVELGAVGSPASVPILRSLLTFPKVDVQIVAMCRIAHLVGRQESKLYASALLGTWYRQKWAALNAIQTTADTASLDAVLRWSKRRRAAIRRGAMHHQQALEVMLYLYRLADEYPLARQAFAELAADSLRLQPKGNTLRRYEAFVDAWHEAANMAQI